MAITMIATKPNGEKRTIEGRTWGEACDKAEEWGATCIVDSTGVLVKIDNEFVYIN